MLMGTAVKISEDEEKVGEMQPTTTQIKYLFEELRKVQNLEHFNMLKEIKYNVNSYNPLISISWN